MDILSLLLEFNIVVNYQNITTFDLVMKWIMIQ